MTLAIRPATGRRSSWIAVFLVAVASIFAALPTFAQDYVLRAAPEWVETLDVPPADQAGRGSDGTRYLLLDDQVNITLIGKPAYRRVVYGLELERALAAGGQFSVDYQPQYQQVELHAIDVLRDGVRRSRLRDAKIEVLRREDELESGILDGQHTLSVTIPDLKAGDIVDYSYTVIGFNPIFGGDYYDSFWAAFSTPLGLRRVRAVHGTGKPLHWRAPSGRYRVSESGEGGHRIVDIRAGKLPRIREESDVSGSHEVYGRIELTTAAQWRDVVQWALPLYPSGIRDRAVAKALTERLALNAPDKVAAMARAVAYVQGEIRYTALDMGRNSHAPYPPETTVARRFGDCKDKALLLVALLAEAGIRAQPVLVNTEAREGLASRMPSGYQFDHVVVRAVLDNREYWIDATRDRETGAFEARAPLPFKLGLPICAACDALVGIPMPMPRAPEVDVGQVIQLGETPSEFTADYTVVTEYRNHRATDIRDRFADDGAEVLQEEYLQYMRKFQEAMTSPAAPELRETGVDSVARVLERYRLAWKRDAGDAFDVMLFQLEDYLPNLQDKPRRMPLELAGPQFARQTIRTRSEGGWDISPETEQVANRYFRFERTVRVEGDTLVIVGEWRRLADTIAPQDHAAVRKDVATVRELLAFGIDLDVPLSDRFITNQRVAWPVIGMAFVALAGFLAWRWRRRVAPAGMLFDPRTTIRSIATSPRMQFWSFVLLFAVGTVDVLAFGDLDHAAKLDAGNLGQIVGSWIGYFLKFAIFAALVCWGFRLTSSPVPYRTFVVASVWSAAPPLLIGYAGALLALGGDSSLLAKDTQVPDDRFIAMIVAGLFLSIASGWALVASINAWSAIAGVSRRHALGATAIGSFAAVIIFLPFIVAGVFAR